MPADKQPPQPRHWRQVVKRDNPDYLYAEDLGPAGTKFDVEIIDSGAGTVKNPDGQKAVIWLAFRGAKKKLGLGATGCKAMFNVSGSNDWADWRGWITLTVIRRDYFDATTGQKEEGEAIRIAPQRPRERMERRETTPTPEEQAEIARREARREAEGKS